MFNAWRVVWEAGTVFLNNFIEAYFTYHKIHPFQMFNPVILVTFLSGTAITITQFYNIFIPPQ